ncbi:hypothetical protein BDN72DRAFT_904689 [Pluteus cervinus]|uniref:Uncharacterized protein n=1 Tax=Pluteus cervinus TaxID=181527 RepID=A0ACD3A520_9AGAR|nr:hypothetical protein BDN72DRAFT_904689 [Pluteus cervinus]
MDGTVVVPVFNLNTRSPTRHVMCRYDITLIYEGKTNTRVYELQRAAISARLLLNGNTIQDVEQCKTIVNEGPTGRIRWKLGGYFATQPTLSSFAIYVSLKSPKQERTILEAKFHQQFIQALQGGYTWDIVASKFLDDGFSLSLETHHFHPSYERVDIFHETKTGTTFLHMNSFLDDHDASLEREKQLVQDLLDLPSSETRAIVLLINGFHLISRHQFQLISHHRHTASVTYCDLAIQAISAACAYSQSIRRQWEPDLCEFLFFRCTRPDGHLFLDNAIDVLKGLDSVSLAETAMEKIGLLHNIFGVLLGQNRFDYAAIALPVLMPSLRVLATEHRTKIIALVVHRALVLCIRANWDMKETLSILDLILPVTALHLPEEHAAYLIVRAEYYIDLYEGGGELGRDSVVTAIDDLQTHLLRYGKPNALNVQNKLYSLLEKASSFLLQAGSALTELDFTGPVRMLAIFYILGIAYGWEGSRSTMSLVIVPFMDLFTGFRYRRPLRSLTVPLHSLTAQNAKKFIQAIYAEHVALEDSDVDLLTKLLLRQIDFTLVTLTPSAAPQPRILAAIKYSLSSAGPPRDELALMRVMVAAPAARFYDLPITLRAYQLLMAAHEIWAPISAPLSVRQTFYRFATFMVHDAISGLPWPGVKSSTYVHHSSKLPRSTPK